MSGDEGDTMVIVNAALAVCPAVSATWAVKPKVPVAVGVPLISPGEAFSDTPAGSEPAALLQV